MLQALYTSPLRSFLRALGITRLLQLPQHLRARRRAAQWRQHSGDTVTVTVAGTSMEACVGSEFEFCRALALRDDEHILNALLSQCRPGAVYWDVGANLGHYAIVMANAVGRKGRVFAFEPEPRVRERLAENLALNGCTNVTVVPRGLSDHGGTATFYVASDQAAGTHSLVSQDPDGQLTTIELTTGDAFVGDGNPLPSVIKIDIEGAELAALRGMDALLHEPALIAVLCEVHFAILEASGQSHAPAQIQRLLQDAGFHDQAWIDASHLLACRVPAA